MYVFPTIWSDAMGKEKLSIVYLSIVYLYYTKIYFEGDANDGLGVAVRKREESRMA